MPSITIRATADEDELEQLYRLRAEVFFGEQILKKGVEKRIADERDHWPETQNLVVLNEDQKVIGGGRIIFASNDRVPVNNRYFDFRPHLSDEGKKSAVGELLTLDRAYRSSSIGPLLIRSGIYVAALAGMEHFCVAARPVLMDHLARFGFRTVAEPFDHPVERVPVVPAVVNLGVEVEIIDLRTTLEPILDMTKLERSISTPTAE